MIIEVAETGSTNADIVARAATGAAEGLWIRADSQTGGKGRLGRQWESPRGNLYASTLVRLKADDPAAHTLSLVAAIALVETVKEFAPRAAIAIKWPNDVLLSGNKLAGILLERQLDYVVIGFGVNLAHAPQIADRVTAALSQIIAAPAPQIFCEGLCGAFVRGLARWRGKTVAEVSPTGLAATMALWLDHAHPIGTPLVTTGADGRRVEGIFAGLTSDAMLNLRLPNGETMIVHSGDIEISRS